VDDCFDGLRENDKYSDFIDMVEIALARTALGRTGTAKEAALILGVNYRTFRRMLGQ